MKVRYTVTLNDFVAWNLHVTKKSGVGRTAHLVTWLALPMFFAWLAIQLLQDENKPAALVLVVLALFWLAVFPSIHQALLARNVRTFVKKLGGRGIIGERTLILSEELLVVISETFRTEVRWENLTGVEVVGDYTYIFLSGISALIVPRHGFESEAEYEGTRDFALRKLEGHVPP